jgi:hypothetical protein
MNRLSAAVLTLTVSIGCGGSPVQPSAPPPPAPGPAESPIVRLAVSVDDAGARDAIAGVSEIVVDATGSTGAGALTFAVDFGDGASTTGATARHVYAQPGTFTVTVQARDAQGRSASGSREVRVQALIGNWFHAGYNSSVHRVEVRRLEILEHDGVSVRGLYKRTGQPDRSFTGTLTPPRSVRIVADLTTLEGRIPSRLGEESEPWPLHVRGGGFDGEPLEFRAIVAEPTGPPPDADLRVSIDSFGSPVAIVSLSPIAFDGSKSRGSGLSYFIDFGDDEFVSAATATHTIAESGEYTARLTVVDRFGRADTEKSAPYYVFSLATGMDRGWSSSDGSGSALVDFDFERRPGVSLTGTFAYWSGNSEWNRTRCTAVLSGERDIHIVVASLGIEFRGYIDMSGSVYTPRDSVGASSVVPPMLLTQIGGANNGRSFTFTHHPGH